MSEDSIRFYRISMCEKLVDELEKGAGKSPELRDQLLASSDTLNIIREYVHHDADLNDAWRMVDYLNSIGKENLAEQIATHLPTREGFCYLR
jgi:hypothetical protein